MSKVSGRQMTDEELLTQVKLAADLVTAESRRRRRLWTAITVVFVIAIAVGVFAWKNYQRNNDIIAARTASRIVSCQDHNDFAQKHNALVDQDEETIREAAAGAQNPNDPQLLTFLEQRLKGYESDRVVVRDCSPAAVNDYYNSLTR